MCDVRHSRYNEPITAIIGKPVKHAMNGSKKNERRGAAFPLCPQAARSNFQLASLTYQLTIEHASLTHQLTIEQPSLTHQLTIEQPSLTYQLTIEHPSLTHQLTIEHPSL